MNKIINYLNHHPQLITILFTGLIKATEIFGSNTYFQLEIVNDPESKEYSKLFAFIISLDFPEKTIDLLEKFDKEWFLEQNNQILELLTFSIR